MFILRFPNLETVTVKTEYLLYDFISTIGNVGGTLGLFIGFSFSGLISYTLHLINSMFGGMVKSKIDCNENSRKILMVKAVQNGIRETDLGIHYTYSSIYYFFRGAHLKN